jgi:hypothetical protein
MNDFQLGVSFGSVDMGDLKACMQQDVATSLHSYRGY